MRYWKSYQGNFIQENPTKKTGGRSKWAPQNQRTFDALFSEYCKRTTFDFEGYSQLTKRTFFLVSLFEIVRVIEMTRYTESDKFEIRY